MSDVPMSSANSFSNTFKSFFELMKPRVMSLVIFTALVGIVIAPTKASFFNSAMSLLFVALGAGAAGAAAGAVCGPDGAAGGLAGRSQ